MRIYCIGLGVRSGDLSVRAAKLLYGCGRIVLRTARTECSAALEGFDCVSLDGIYDTAADFDSLAEVLAERVLELAEGADFCAYCVPGSGVDDTSVAALFGKVKNRKDVEIIPAAGASASALAAYAPQLSYQSLSAYDVKPGAVNTRLPLVIYELDNPLLAGEVKLVLSELYGDGAEVYIDGKRKALNEIDRQKKYGYATTLIVPPIPLLEKQRFSLSDLTEIMGILRAPGGCPWDREQTHLSIRNNAVEEAYEVVDAIDLGDTELLQEELGDLLLQAVFHSVIAEKEEEFNLNDVISGLCAKLIFRHKHVFGTVTAKNGAEALLTWENAKLEKKSYATVTEELLAVPKSFPQALRAVKLQKKAGKANYGILNPDGALARLREELEEFAVGGGGERAELSAGECLFSLVNVLRLAGIDPEVALNRASDGFIREFAAVERLADKRGLELHGMTCDAVGRLCREAKPEE